jgi:hypothetical protein
LYFGDNLRENSEKPNPRQGKVGAMQIPDHAAPLFPA